MRKFINLFFLILLVLPACKSNSAPKDIIDKPHMISLMTEVEIVDGTLYNVIQSPDSLYKYGMGKYFAVFTRFGTDSAHFNKSLRYYTTKPEELQAICDQVLLNLKQKTDSLNKLQLKQNALPKK